jgi:hypothetical protein
MKFNCYRYQLCIDNGIIDERSFSSENMTAKEAFDHKNELFIKYIKNEIIKIHDDDKTLYTSNEIKDEDDYLVFKIGKKSTTNIKDKDLITIRKEPSYNQQIYIVVDKSRDTQVLAIEDNNCFSFDLLQTLIFNNVTLSCKSAFLTLEINPILETNTFWDFVKSNKKSIKEFVFTVHSQNMSVNNKNAAELIQSLRADSGAETASLNLQASSNSSLNIDDNNPDFIAMSDLTTEGIASSNITAYDDNGKIEFNSKLDKSIRSVRSSNLDLCMKDNQKFSNELSELIQKLRKYVV